MQESAPSSPRRFAAPQIVGGLDGPHLSGLKSHMDDIAASFAAKSADPAECASIIFSPWSTRRLALRAGTCSLSGFLLKQTDTDQSARPAMKK